MNLLKTTYFIIILSIFLSCQKYADSELERLHNYKTDRDSIQLICDIEELATNSNVILSGMLNNEKFCYDMWDMSHSSVSVADRTLDLYEKGYIVEKVNLGVGINSEHYINQPNGFETIFALYSPTVKEFVDYEQLSDSIFTIGSHKVFKYITFTIYEAGEKPDYKIEDAWQFYFGFESHKVNDNSPHYFSEGNGSLDIINVEKIDYGQHIEYDVTFHIYGKLDCPYIADLAGTICYDIDLEWKQKYYIPG